MIGLKSIYLASSRPSLLCRIYPLGELDIFVNPKIYSQEKPEKVGEYNVYSEMIPKLDYNELPLRKIRDPNWNCQRRWQQCYTYKTNR